MKTLFICIHQHKYTLTTGMCQGTSQPCIYASISWYAESSSFLRWWLPLLSMSGWLNLRTSWSAYISAMSRFSGVSHWGSWRSPWRFLEGHQLLSFWCFGLLSVSAFAWAISWMRTPTLGLGYCYWTISLSPLPFQHILGQHPHIQSVHRKPPLWSFDDIVHPFLLLPIWEDNCTTSLLHVLLVHLVARCSSWNAIFSCHRQERLSVSDFLQWFSKCPIITALVLSSTSWHLVCSPYVRHWINDHSSQEPEKSGWDKAMDILECICKASVGKLVYM